MKVEFHWERELPGLIVHSAQHVQVNLLDDDGSIPKDGGKLELHWEYWPGVSLWKSSSGGSSKGCRAFGQEGRAAFDLPLDKAAEAGLARIEWRLKDENWLVARGSSLCVSAEALGTQRWALHSLVVLLLVWALLLPNLKGTFDYFNGLLLFFAGGVGVAIVKPLREAASRLLLRRRLALTCILGSALGLLVAVMCFRKVYNLSLEACYFGDVVVEPKSAALVWWTDEPKGCSHAAVIGRDSGGLMRGPHRAADVRGIVPWLPLLSREVHCTTGVPDLFREPWLKSGRCQPDELASVIDLPTDMGGPMAHGKATLAYATARSAALSTSPAVLASWSFDRYLRVGFRNLRGLEVDARGHQNVAAVAYEPLAENELGVILPMALEEPSGSFEFLLGGQRLGSVTIQNQPPDASARAAEAGRRPDIACAKLAPAVGIQSVLLGTESLQRYYRTAITQVEGSVFAPICFDQGRRADEAIITFASGWSPRTAHRLELPCDMLPARLSLQTGTGEWLGTLETRAPLSAGAGACWINVQAVAWTGLHQPVLEYSWMSSAGTTNGPPELEVTLPASVPGFGSIAWSVVQAPGAAEHGHERPALPVGGSADDLVISGTGEVRLTPRRAPSYIYVKGALVRGTCPMNTRPKASPFAENLARSRGLSFSVVRVCQASGADQPLVASGS